MKQPIPCAGYKHGFRSRGDVPDRLRRVCDVYRCQCGKFHVTTKRKKVRR